MNSLEQLCETVKSASESGEPLNICGGGSKSFLGYTDSGEQQIVDTRVHNGILSYHPEELVIRAKSGTPVTEVSEVLSEHNQMLAFEPPVFDGSATVGGSVASGLSGAGRPYRGAVRDFVLGVGLILQNGEYAEFGGQVMKNVAGYDVSRLVCGAFGMLGVIADVSLRVMPKPAAEKSLVATLSMQDARSLVGELTGRVSPLTAACYLGGRLHLRLSGSEEVVQVESKRIDGESLASDFWQLLDNQQLNPFRAANDVWRLSTGPGEACSDDDFQVLDWGFAQRWLLDPVRDPRQDYKGTGHWTRFRCNEPAFKADVFEPLPAVKLKLHKSLKQAFDGKGIFNPARMYRDI